MRINQQKSSNMDHPVNIRSYALIYAIVRDKKTGIIERIFTATEDDIEPNKTFSLLISSRNNNYMSQYNHCHILQATSV